MRDDPPAAALRLACTLPCRTHERGAPPPPMPQAGKRVEIGGTVYASLSEAARVRHKSRHSIRRMIYANKARYVR